MTLGPIFLCCDDGNYYRLQDDCVHGCGWDIVFYEDGDDLFRVMNRSRKKGEAAQLARPIVEPMELVWHEELPIESLDFYVNRSRNDVEFGEFKIKWTGAPFPRHLLPAGMPPTRSKHRLSLGTKVLMSEEFLQLNQEVA